MGHSQILTHYRRVLFKLSGEILVGQKRYGIDPLILQHLSLSLKEVVAKGIEVCLVIGGGNIFRGSMGEAMGVDRSTADHMGMLSTVINALALQSTLENLSIHTRVQSAIPMEALCESYIARRAIRHMEKKRIVIFAAGVGHPYLTTDTAAALRAAEMHCDVIIKGTKVDGVYSEDPYKKNNAHRYEQLSYQDVLNQQLQVMDPSAIALAQQRGIPIIVFSLQKPHAFSDIFAGRGYYTLITNGPDHTDLKRQSVL